MSFFTHLLSTLPEGMRGRIMAALGDGPFADVDELRASITGMTRADITSFLQEDDFLNKVDASALAGLLVAPTGQYISINLAPHAIIPSLSRFDDDPISLIMYLIHSYYICCFLYNSSSPWRSSWR